jgi:hypothetical protein
MARSTVLVFEFDAAVIEEAARAAPVGSGA